MPEPIHTSHCRCRACTSPASPSARLSQVSERFFCTQLVGDALLVLCGAVIGSIVTFNLSTL